MRSESLEVMEKILFPVHFEQMQGKSLSDFFEDISLPDQDIDTISYVIESMVIQNNKFSGDNDQIILRATRAAEAFCKWIYTISLFRSKDVYFMERWVSASARMTDKHAAQNPRVYQYLSFLRTEKPHLSGWALFVLCMELLNEFPTPNDTKGVAPYAPDSMEDLLIHFASQLVIHMFGQI